MHRLRKGKKGNKEDEDGVPPVPQPSTSHNPFKWGRTPEPPPKPQLDLEHALPPTDDFRTSLLMPNLAQRFSILQMEMAAAAAAAAAAGKLNGENPSASGGVKVVDGTDGFVFTSPQFMPMGEITETSSLVESGTAQQNGLTAKSQESLASDDGGIMNRSRGGEGNVLFGGRQKVYRVPNAYTSGRDSTEDSNPGSPMGGRSVGTYDLPENTFTSPKQRREQQKLDSEEANGDSVSDSNEYNKNRDTNSSTNSTPTTITRSSTAATSVTSNRTPSGSIPASSSTSSLSTAPGAIVTNKPRRALYEQALDQQLQDQQSTAVGRLERLASLRKASVSPPPRNNYPLKENYSSPQLGQQNNISPVSPVSPQQPQWTVNIKKSPDSPMSTPEEDEEEENDDEMEKVDKKPVAGPGLSPHMAQFNFGLEPRSQSPISPPVSASAIQFPTQGPFSPGNLPSDQQQRNKGPDSSAPLEQKRIPSPLSDISDQYGQSGVGANSRKTFLSMRSSTSDSSYDEDSENDRTDEESKPVSRSSLDHVAPLHPHKQSSASSSPVSPPMGPTSPGLSVSPVSPISNDEVAIDGVKPLRNPIISPTSPRFSADKHILSDDDSPTLPPGQGLSMLVRQHLRTDSGHSSVYAGSTYTRMSRTSHYGMGGSKNSKTPSTARPSVSGASGSSHGNLWEFDDWDGGYYGEDDSNNNNGPPSPPTAGDALPQPPTIPTKAPTRVRSEERKDDEEIASERQRGRTESRLSDRDRALSRASERERSIPDGEDEHDKDWEQQLAFRRQIIQQNLRNHEKVNSQHEPFPAEDFKASQSKNGGSSGGFGVLRSKGSNGLLSKNDPSIKPLRPNGRDSPSPGLRKDGSRSRMNSDADKRYEEERRLRDTVRGPKNIPPGNYQMQQHPPHSHHHIPPPHLRHHPAQPLNTNQPMDLRPQQRSPVGLPHPLHSPMHTPRVKQRPSREQMNGGYNGGQSASRGQPMGWRDERDHFNTSRSAPGTQPGTPTAPRDGHMPRKQPSMPRMNGPDMYRPNQGQFRDQEPRQGRPHPERSRGFENGSSPGGPMNHGPSNHGPMNHGPMNHGPMNNGPSNNTLNKKQSFDRDAPPPGSELRRPRGNSNAAPGPTMRQRRGTFDGTPLPPLNTAALAIPQPQPLSSVPPQSAVTAEKSPAISQMQRTPTSASVTTPSSAVSSAVSSAKTPPAALIQSIASSNVGYTPAKKRVIDKSKIGEPKLVSSTSNIPTVDLPAQNTTPPLSAGGMKDKDVRKRRMTETRGIFGGFGKNKSTEEVPALPTGSPMMQRHHTDDEVERSSFNDDDPPPKKKGGAKLRKSTSDGGALSARARKQEAMARSPTVPKISKAISGAAPAGMI